MQVQELMSRRVLTIVASDSCREAVARMARARVRHLPVLDGAGALVGVVTDRDLRHHLFTPGVFERLGTVGVDVLLEAVSVAAIMSAPVISVGPGEELAKAACLMAAEKVGSLPVVTRSISGP